MNFKIVIIAAFMVTLTHGQSHTIDDCLKPGNATVLYTQEISKDGAFLQTQEQTIRIPDVGFSPKPISCITVINLDNDSNAGYPKIMNGGVGQNYVVIELKSQFGKGFDFRVTVYYDENA